jgi:hypothetical protein
VRAAPATAIATAKNDVAAWTATAVPVGNVASSQVPNIPGQPCGHDEKLACQVPCPAQCLRPLVDVLDDIHNEAEIGNIRRTAISMWPVRRIPAVGGIPECPQMT